jgi:hypothetical protein
MDVVMSVLDAREDLCQWLADRLVSLGEEV